MPPKKGEKHRSKDFQQQPIYSEPAMRNNVAVLEYSRTCQVIL